jgi:hypothetical protein
MEPDSQTLYEIRNHLEHKYLKVHGMDVPRPRSAAPDLWTDRLAYSVGRQELQDKAVRVVKLVRAALIFLALGMHREEGLRAKGKDKKRIAPMILNEWDDAWKE